MATKAKASSSRRRGARFLEAYEARLKETVKHPRLGRSVSYRRLIRLDLYKLEKHLLGDETYEPYVSRW